MTAFRYVLHFMHTHGTVHLRTDVSTAGPIREMSDVDHLEARLRAHGDYPDDLTIMAWSLFHNDKRGF